MTRYLNTSNNPNLQAALALAQAGIPVFPVTPDRHPLCKWKEEATTDERRIRKWWRWKPDALPAFPTGEASGFAVLDLDRKDGKDGVAVLEAMGLDPDTLSWIIVETASGGLHLYFRHKLGLRCSVGQAKDGLAGVDVRAEHGFVVAPGAVSPKGTYRFVKGDLDTLALSGAPEWPAALPMQPRERAADASSTAEPSGLPFYVLRDALMSMSLEQRERHFGSDLAWFTVARIIADESGASEEGRELWHDWSDGWGGYDYHVAEDKWNREDTYAGERATVWTILRPAMNGGWTHPEFEKWRTAEAAADFDGPDEEELAAILALVGGAPEGEADHPFGTPDMNGDKPVNNLRTACFYLHRSHDEIAPQLRWNEMTGRAECSWGEIGDAGLERVRMGMESSGMKTIGAELVAPAVRQVALNRAYHPVRDQLNALCWDGVPRLDSLLSRFFGADDTPYTRAVGRMFVVQMVARVMEPGCKADYMPVLHGEQGQMKSTACRVLAGGRYFSDSLPAIRGDNPKEAMAHLQGLWLVEVAEMASMREAAQEDLKSFLSRQVDRYRAPYGRVDEEHPRQCVFIGTTNKEYFLKDETGGRRFWPVACNRPCDPEGLARARDQLFAEAVAAYRAGEQWWPDREFERVHLRPMQEATFAADPWEDEIADLLAKPEGGDFDFSGKPRREVMVREVFDLLGLPVTQRNRKTEMRVAGILRDRLGWEKIKSHGRSVWRRQPGARLELVK